MSSALTPSEMVAARDVQAYGWSSMAAFAWICYDTVVVMDQEVIHIWRAKWSTGKVLYLLSRYVTIAGVLLWWLSTLQSLSTSGCQNVSIMSGITLLITGVSVDLIQLLRIRAIYSCRRYITFPLYLLFAGVFLAAILVVVVSDQNSTTLPNTAFDIGCLTNPDTSGTLIAWIGEMCLGAIFFVLTLAKLHTHLRGKGKTTALTAVVQGGVIYYAVIFVAELLNVLLLQILPKGSRTNLSGISQPWTLAVYGIAGPRLVLHLKGVISSPEEIETHKIIRPAAGPRPSRPTNSVLPSQPTSTV